ncbi:hypothetical protein N9Y92_03530, partial [Chlamydiales bacterium]|nr:hypothetical protein [Chlamydiales bacterium]
VLDDIENNPEFEETTHPKAENAGHRKFENEGRTKEIKLDEAKPDKTGHKSRDHYHYSEKDEIGEKQFYDKNKESAKEHSSSYHIYPDGGPMPWEF